MIRVLLADDHSIVRAGLRRIVEESGDIEVVAEASDGREAVLAVRKEKPDVAVIAAQPGGITGNGEGGNPPRALTGTCPGEDRVDVGLRRVRDREMGHTR